MNESIQPTYLNLEYIFNQIYQFLAGLGGSFSGFSFAGIKIFIGIVCMLILGLIFYLLIRLYELREERIKILSKVDAADSLAPPKNEKWIEVAKYMNSSDHANWKLAIIEADLMLEDMLTRMGYKGANLGEKLKSIEKSDFTNLQNAWEAHKVRNRIAHEGSDFSVSRTEARRVIGLYELCFREFDYI